MRIMASLYYCVDCHRVFKSNDKCEYCDSQNLKELRRGTSVNILGTKSKGQVFKLGDEEVSLILITESKERIIKSYMPEQLKKIL